MLSGDHVGLCRKELLTVARKGIRHSKDLMLDVQGEDGCRH
jgi:hypothetical protein